MLSALLLFSYLNKGNIVLTSLNESISTYLQKELAFFTINFLITIK